MLYAVLMRYDSLREIVVGMLSESNKINHLGIDYMVKRSTLAEANNRRSNEFFEQIYFSLYRKYRNDLADSRTDKAWEHLLHIMDIYYNNNIIAIRLSLTSHYFCRLTVPSRYSKNKGTPVGISSLSTSSSDNPSICITIDRRLLPCAETNTFLPACNCAKIFSV